MDLTPPTSHKPPRNLDQLKKSAPERSGWVIFGRICTHLNIEPPVRIKKAQEAYRTEVKDWIEKNFPGLESSKEIQKLVNEFRSISDRRIEAIHTFYTHLEKAGYHTAIKNKIIEHYRETAASGVEGKAITEEELIAKVKEFKEELNEKITNKAEEINGNIKIIQDIEKEIEEKGIKIEKKFDTTEAQQKITDYTKEYNIDELNKLSEQTNDYRTTLESQSSTNTSINESRKKLNTIVNFLNENNIKIETKIPSIEDDLKKANKNQDIENLEKLQGTIDTTIESLKENLGKEITELNIAKTRTETQLELEAQRTAEEILTQLDQSQNITESNSITIKPQIVDDTLNNLKLLNLTTNTTKSIVDALTKEALSVNEAKNSEKVNNFENSCKTIIQYAQEYRTLQEKISETKKNIQENNRAIKIFEKNKDEEEVAKGQQLNEVEKAHLSRLEKTLNQRFQIIEALLNTITLGKKAPEELKITLVQDKTTPESQEKASLITTIRSWANYLAEAVSTGLEIVTTEVVGQQPKEITDEDIGISEKDKQLLIKKLAIDYLTSDDDPAQAYKEINERLATLKKLIKEAKVNNIPWRKINISNSMQFKDTKTLLLTKIDHEITKTKEAINLKEQQNALLNEYSNLLKECQKMGIKLNPFKPTIDEDKSHIEQTQNLIAALKKEITEIQTKIRDHLQSQLPDLKDKYTKLLEEYKKSLRFFKINEDTFEEAARKAIGNPNSSLEELDQTQINLIKKDIEDRIATLTGAIQSTIKLSPNPESGTAKAIPPTPSQPQVAPIGTARKPETQGPIAPDPNLEQRYKQSQIKAKMQQSKAFPPLKPFYETMDNYYRPTIPDRTKRAQKLETNTTYSICLMNAYVKRSFLERLMLQPPPQALQQAKLNYEEALKKATEEGLHNLPDFEALKDYMFNTPEYTILKSEKEKNDKFNAFIPGITSWIKDRIAIQRKEDIQNSYSRR